MTALLLMAACDKQEELENEQTGCAMEFYVAGLTRASLTTSQNLTESPFAVYGDMIYSGNQSGTVIFNGSEVFHDGTDWKYADTQYWFPNHEHSFVAYHPANAPCLSDIQYQNSQLQFTYKYPVENYAAANDVVVASHRRKYTEGKTDAVCFTFSHILSNINVTVTNINPAPEPPSLIITGLTFKNIPIEGIYGLTPAPLNGSASTADYVFPEDSSDGWRVSTRGDLEINFPETGEGVRMIPPDTRPYHLFSGNDALMLLPNPQAPTELLLSYVTGEGSERTSNTQRLSIPHGWSPGFNYTLSLTVINKEVQFSIEVTDWEATDPITVTVPRK